MNKDKLAVVCPGQGAHAQAMLDGHVGTAKFNEYYAIVSDTIGYAPLDDLRKDPSKLNSILMSSMLTVLASCLSYHKFVDSKKSVPDYLCGYSVGQLTSLFLAGCFDFEHLVLQIKTRSEIITEFVERKPYAMLAVIGVLLEPLSQLLSEMQAENHLIYISNYNCAGQYSLAGTRSSIDEAKSRISNLNPRVLAEIPVEYAWHCPLVEAAEPHIVELMKHCQWRLPEIPVVNCQTGDWFSNDIELIKKQYSTQLANPVRWDVSMKTLLAAGCSRFVEVGYGNTLTKFGFFIDRSVQHESYYGEKVATCAE